MHRSALIPSGTWLSKRSRAHAYTSRLANVPAGYNFHTMVQLKGSKVQPEGQERAQTGTPKTTTGEHLILWYTSPLKMAP